MCGGRFDVLIMVAAAFRGWLGDQSRLSGTGRSWFRRARTPVFIAAHWRAGCCCEDDRGADAGPLTIGGRGP